MCIVLLSPERIPVPASTGTSLPDTTECSLSLARLEILCNIHVCICTRKSHRDVVVVVEHSLVSIAELSCATCSPSTIVSNNPVAVLVVVAVATVLRTPVNLSNNDRLACHNRNLLLEGVDRCVVVVLSIRSAVPIRIEVYGITVIVIVYRILGIVSVVRLPSCTRNKNDTSVTVLTDNVDDRLEEIAHCSLCILTVLVEQLNRLVGKLNHHSTRVLYHVRILCYDVPNCLQIVLVSIANLDSLRTYARRTHDDVHSVVKSLLCDRPVNSLHILLQAST